MNRDILNLLLPILLISFSFPQRTTAGTVSEFQPNPKGFDNELQQFEISGEAGEFFSGVLLGIGGELGRTGRVDYAERLEGRFDTNGLLTMQVADLFSPTLTIVLTDSFSGMVGQTDIDLNNDGIADDISSLGMIHDALGVPDNVTGQSFLYGSQLGGADFRFTGDEPELVFRDGSDGAWFALNDLLGTEIHNLDGLNVADDFEFDKNPFQPTFNARNPSLISSVPEPGSGIFLAFLAAAQLTAGRRKRRLSH